MNAALTSFSFSFDGAFQLCIASLCISMAIASLEFLALRREFADGGAFSWQVLSSRRFTQAGSFFFGPIFGYRPTIFLLLLRLALSLYLPFLFGTHLFLWALGLLLLISMGLLYRNFYGHDGSDQMSHLILVTLFLSQLSTRTDVRSLGLAFIALQAILSYVVAGVAKLVSASWRNGSAVTKIMKSRAYGHPIIAALFGNSRILRLTAAWGVILFECGFLLTPVLPRRGLLLLLAGGAGFHLFIALVMNLNTFFWSFLATYPCLLWANKSLGDMWKPWLSTHLR